MNQPAKRSTLASFFIGTWNVVNFTRKLILNLLFFGFIFFFLLILMMVAASKGNSGVRPLQDRTTLNLNLNGRLVEQFSSDPLSRAISASMGQPANNELQLRDVLRVIEAAKTDKKIERVVLDVDNLSLSGYASLREIANALRGLRESGKQIVAFSESLGQGQYLLAAQANEVYLDPMGSVRLEGLSSFQPYFRQGLQEKLGVDVNVFRVGEYKSFAEPFILDAPSEDAKTADLFWMNDIWQRHLQDISDARKLPLAELNQNVENYAKAIVDLKGNDAQLALNQKLVDGLKTTDETQQMLAERGQKDESYDEGYRTVDYQNYLRLLQARQSPLDKRPQVAVVVAQGSISGGEQPPGKVGGVSTAALLKQARLSKDVKSVVLRVDSPGGQVFASEQIRREVVALKAAGKPVVVSMGDAAASGGYWISMNADKIYADASTISGSIGIFAIIPNFTRALEKVGVRTGGVKTAPLAGMMDPTRPMDDATKQVLQISIEKGYNDFITNIANARSMKLEDVDMVARGRVWTGTQAKERGLVDELGGLNDAIVEAAKRAKYTSSSEYRVNYLEHSGSPFEQFVAGLSQSKMGAYIFKEYGLGDAILARSVPTLKTQLDFIEEAKKSSDGKRVKTVAYCFCEL